LFRSSLPTSPTFGRVGEAEAFRASRGVELLALEGDLRQLAAQDLAGGVLRDGINELHRANLLVRCHAVGDPAHELLCPQLRALTLDDERARDLQAVALRADDADVCDVRMGEQQALQFGRRDLIALVLDDLLGAVNDAQPAILSELGDVTGTPPPASNHSFRIGFLVVQIALPALRATDENFPRLALGNIFQGVDINEADFRVCHRLTDAGMIGVAVKV